MVTVAVVTSPNTTEAPDCVPRRIFEDQPGIEIEIERFVPLGDIGVPYFWVRGDDLDEVERTLGRYDEVADVDRLERVEGAGLYRVEWTIDSPTIRCIQRSAAVLLSAHGTAARWRLEIWFEPESEASSLLRCCADNGVPIEVERLHSLAEVARDATPAVTPRQAEALSAAYEHGYFEKPRAVSQRELADELGISAAALGTRLRRGTANMIERQRLDQDTHSPFDG